MAATEDPGQVSNAGFDAPFHIQGGSPPLYLRSQLTRGRTRIKVNDVRPAFVTDELTSPKMRLLALTALVSLACSVFAQTSVDSYVATESPIAKAGLLANIGPSGSKSSGAKVS